MILSGPPGVGKTTIASILAACADYVFLELSATDATVAQLRDLLTSIRAENQKRAAWSCRTDARLKVAVFIDEIHRFSKVQQDFLLPFVESGDFVFIGATTVEPHKRIRRGILSRCQLFCLESLNEQDSYKILERAVLFENIRRKRYKNLSFIHYSNDAIKEITNYSQGDMRSGINCIELLSSGHSRKEHGIALGDGNFINLDLEVVKLTLASLTKTRLGLKDERNLLLVSQLLSWIGDEYVIEITQRGSFTQTKALKPLVFFKRNSTLFFVKFKLPLVSLCLLDMECNKPYPRLSGDLNDKQVKLVQQMEVSDDSDEDLEAKVPRDIVIKDDKSTYDRFRLFSAIHTMTNLIERGESALLILKYLIVFTCLFTSGENNEIRFLNSAVCAVKKAAVDPLHILCDCIEYLCFADKADHSIMKKMDAFRLFLTTRLTTKSSDEVDFENFKVVYDNSLAAKLLQADESSNSKSNEIEKHFKVDFVELTELNYLKEHLGFKF